MKRVLITSFLVLFLSSLTLPVLTVADGDGLSANGRFQLSLGNGQTREIQFNAQSTRDGSTTGEIIFRDGQKVLDPKSPDDTTASEAAPPFYAKAVCDCLMVKGIEAVLSGTISEASAENYIGRRVLLVVQDGDSLTPPLRDKLTYGFYRTSVKGWVASDGERADEQGPAPTWVATDAERPDDVGILSQKSEEVTCESFPISSHTFIDARQGKGKIQVTSEKQ